ncbi:MAG: hypothetical protein VYE40_07675 [Myxococcota bacterium]|nr:hypothetical protein [Myxococcota bacterium]
MEKQKDEMLMVAVAIAFLLGATLTGYLGWSMMQKADAPPSISDDSRGSSSSPSPSP